ncbi:hypothetical protein NW768_004180 [Fusarium equiseti]|uniref:Protein kinase domain-containing protein n=1 Tax=Fusarium equiseti TaxID=61235 RepID=A0ABQ8RJR3_FUSEQ|nr:hypothetical protein NW768_004180 [Fusarium equiseti]
MYAAPESFANLQVQHLVKTNVPPVADIWALGAVFSDVLIWSIGGETYREQYRLRRQEEIASQLHLKERGIDACFHNMHDRLKAVDESHRLALDKRPRYDDVSPGLSEIILSFMLVDHEERLQAIHIRSRANKMLRSIQRSPADRDGFLSVGDSIEGSTKDHGTIPVLHQPSPNDRAEMPPVERQDATHQDPAFDESPTTSFPQIQLPAKATEQLIWSERVVTVEEVYALMESPGRTRSRLASLVPRLDKSSFIMSLPGMEIARRRICADIGRDQIMIIDDYSSMRQHMVQVKMAARVISYVAKTADYNGMEVYTASEAAKKPRICITSSQIEKEIGKMKTIEGKCDMGACLNHILDKILIDGKKVKPTSIYIYTDGAWEPRTNVEQPIYRAINHLIQNGQSTSTLMLQFVQFGHDEKGTKHLRFLDDECTKQVGSEI